MVLMLRAVTDIVKKNYRFVGVIFLCNVKQALGSHSNIFCSFTFDGSS